MAQNYTRDQLKISVGKILQTLGWNSINSTPLEILTDILGNYISQITKATNSYSNEFGCTQPNIDHLGLAFRDMGISVPELEEYVKYVNFGPPATPVPKYPLSKDDHLNFLKPGSKEVVTRPVHIHEHLPPMNPLLEGGENDQDGSICNVEEPVEINSEHAQVFKKPDVLPPEFKRPNFRREEEGSRPTREISSVMMTTSGFLSPAREGKLPEARTPVSSMEPVGPPISTSDSMEMMYPKKTTKPVKKVEKRKRPVPNPQQALEEKKRKLVNPRSGPKAKQQKLGPPANFPNGLHQNEIKSTSNKNHQKDNKINRVMAEIQLGKFNTTITPITVKPEVENVDKLFTEPDKKKVNIFKKISNVKNEKNDVKSSKAKDDFKQESRESSPDLIIDEPDEIASKLSHLPSDVTIEPINPTPSRSPDKIDTPYFDDDSPGTPLTPKTPEMISHSPPTVVKEKRKRKEGKKGKKVQKHQSPHRLDSDVLDLDMERPKTPEAQVLPRIDVPLNLGPFPFNFGGPSLIPPLLSSNPLFPTFHAMNIPTFGQKPTMAPIQQNLGVGPPATPLVKTEDHFKTEKVSDNDSSPKSEKKTKEHKKEKKDKLKKRNKKDKIKNKAEKRKLKEEKKDKIKKEKKEKRKDKEIKEESPFNMKITLKIKSPSPRPETPETKKLNIKPIVKKEEDAFVEDRKRETSPGLAKFSALVCGPPKPKVAPPPVVPPPEETIQEAIPAPPPRTGPGPGRPRIHPIKPKPATKPKKRRTPVKKDAEGNEVWICPACGRQDDGSPMIGCDGCDAWYHWVCVGIQVPPDDNEDWYCRLCLSKKNEDLLQSDKKKKRKKREKKEH